MSDTPNLSEQAGNEFSGEKESQQSSEAKKPYEYSARQKYNIQREVLHTRKLQN